MEQQAEQGEKTGPEPVGTVEVGKGGLPPLLWSLCHSEQAGQATPTSNLKALVPCSLLSCSQMTLIEPNENRLRRKLNAKFFQHPFLNQLHQLDHLAGCTAASVDDRERVLC